MPLLFKLITCQDAMVEIALINNKEKIYQKTPKCPSALMVLREYFSQSSPT